MNHFAKSWQRVEQRKKLRPSGCDSVTIDGETFPLPERKMADRQRPHVKAQPEPTTKVQQRAANRVHQSTGRSSVTCNRHGIVELALYGPQNQVEALYRAIYAALSRLRLRTRRTKPLNKAPRGRGAWPNIHDVQVWLDSLEKTKDHAEDLDFLKSLFKTVEARIPPDFDVEQQEQALM